VKSALKAPEKHESKNKTVVFSELLEISELKGEMKPIVKMLAQFFFFKSFYFPH
jgi:hypothetical protein